jgi:RHH-type proline utilization regulon transcriptional repressor/proline dehydrogenase/delta 1-pyrroline-5-carboxylate dehydrogenase
MIFRDEPPPPSALRAELRAMTRADETEAVRALIDEARLTDRDARKVRELASLLVENIRASAPKGLEAMLHEYPLSTQEGVVLLCLAEALLRIPDPATADRFIQGKLRLADWAKHLGSSESLMVNASTWGLMLTGRFVRLESSEVASIGGYLGRLAARIGEPAIRAALSQAMRIVGRQFVMGETIGEALDRAAEEGSDRYSFDMLGEAARTMADADRYREAYAHAIEAMAARSLAQASISVKLSALHPRFEQSQRRRVLAELSPRLKALAYQAAGANIGLCVDAEEADRLDLMLDVIEDVALDRALIGWEGFGLAVQAYQKRAPKLIDWLADLSVRAGRRLQVRLVKGAYWDSEIKRAQEGGFAGYPVFTRKVSTDLSYLACAARLLNQPDRFYPQFATHNAHTLAWVAARAKDRQDFEFQRLYGMGEALYSAALAAGVRVPCRVYAPVGGHAELLPYLVRRLLENGANLSFVNRLYDRALPIERIVADPAEQAALLDPVPNPGIPKPGDLYQPDRQNSAGTDWNDPAELRKLAAELKAAIRPWRAASLINGEEANGEFKPCFDPADRQRVIGEVAALDEAGLESAITGAARAACAWNELAPHARASVLEKAADLFASAKPELLALLVREGGKCLVDGDAELREACDALRYYAARARADFAQPIRLPGPTGESNELVLKGRGVFLCISPWNFPLAIFTGQIAAALAAGNAVIAKPAAATPLVAAKAVALLHQAGVTASALQLVIGSGAGVGAKLVRDPRIGGVAMTGSTETAGTITRILAERPGPIVPLIAETGGLNAMIVDSSALPEQVVPDALRSAFNSAGQRCSALRVLFLQEESADRLLDMLKGAIAELNVGDPGFLDTDVGPVINEEARDRLERHAAAMTRHGRPVAAASLSADCARGVFFAPQAFLIERLSFLTGEVFGPILHIVRYRAEALEAVVDAINATGYGLTLGIHSRVDDTIQRVRAKARVGNIYVNRNMIGAVIGAQPFGGEGLSGTGPKAGGPFYLHRFALERTISTDTTAAGGNAALLALDSD